MTSQIDEKTDLPAAANRKRQVQELDPLRDAAVVTSVEGADLTPDVTSSKKAREASPTAPIEPVSASASPSSAAASLPLLRPCTIRTFTIGGADAADDSTSHPPPLRVSIPEWGSTELGSFLWPSALLLADYIHRQRDWSASHIVGQTVLELGAGRCLNGIHCAMLGAKAVILTDADAGVLRDAELIVQLNGLAAPSSASTSASAPGPAEAAPRVTVLPLDWGDFSPRVRALRGRVDVLIGADVFYDGRDFESVFATVSFFGAPLLTAYQNRGEGLRRFRLLARKWRMKMERLEWQCDIGALMQRAEERRVSSIEEAFPGAHTTASASSSASAFSPSRSSATLHETVSLELLLFTPMARAAAS